MHKIIGEPHLEGSDATRLAERETGRKMTAGEVSDFWLQKSWTYIRTEPLNWVRLLGKKWLMVWNAREVEDSDDFYIYSQMVLAAHDSRMDHSFRCFGATRCRRHLDFAAPMATFVVALRHDSFSRVERRDFLYIRPLSFSFGPFTDRFLLPQR